MNTKEKIIIILLKKGDEKAYKYIFQHHYLVLYKFAYTLLRNKQLAENTVSDVIYHIWEKKETLNITSNLRNYLITAVRNQCYSVARKKEVIHEVDHIEDVREYYIADDKHPLGVLLCKELEGEIIKFIDALPIETQQVFRLSRFEEKSYKEIAEIQNISVNTVKYHIKKALLILRENLKQYL